jgi:hypothetical protein
MEGSSFLVGAAIGTSVPALIFALVNLDLSRRSARKPSWKHAPVWADFLTQDADGAWTWFSSKPVIYDNMWIRNSAHYDTGQFSVVSITPVIGDWRASLESRPEKA